MTAMACLSEDTVLALLQGALEGPELEEVERHLDSCDVCREVVSRVAPSPSTDRPPSKQEGLPPQIGRYSLVGLIGQGGMGVVYRAFDPTLRREVALKLIRSSDVSQGLLLQEAQSMARLSHPNVVAIHDAGTFEDQAFIAMEYIHGETLRKWLVEAPRSWREVLAVLVEVGRGIAAAHRAGLTHRDIKPENVLVDREGRVKVTDFGVARFAKVAAFAQHVLPTDLVPASSMSVTVVTDHGDCAGTPHYMAPEQFSGGEVGPWTDQYAFCVTAYEALFRQRPVRAESMGELMYKVLDGQVEAPPPSPVPKAIVEALLRGLDPTPSLRHSSVEALVALIDKAVTSQAHRRTRFGAVAAAIVIAAGAASWELHRQRQAAEPAAVVAAPASTTVAAPPAPPHETVAARPTPVDVAPRSPPRIAAPAKAHPHRTHPARAHVHVGAPSPQPDDAPDELLDPAFSGASRIPW